MTTLAEDGIFDASAYQLPIPDLDGHKADRLALTFGGGVDLDRTSEDDLEFINGLELGRTVTLKVECIVTKKGFSYSAGKEDGPDSTGYGVGLKVVGLEAVS
jgi:hypothetical protein